MQLVHSCTKKKKTQQKNNQSNEQKKSREIYFSKFQFYTDDFGTTSISKRRKGGRYYYEPNNGAVDRTNHDKRAKLANKKITKEQVSVIFDNESHDCGWGTNDTADKHNAVS
jgi:hypothetical protein